MYIRTKLGKSWGVGYMEPYVALMETSAVPYLAIIFKSYKLYKLQLRTHTLQLFSFPVLDFLVWFLNVRHRGLMVSHPTPNGGGFESHLGIWWLCVLKKRVISLFGPLKARLPVPLIFINKFILKMVGIKLGHKRSLELQAQQYVPTKVAII